MIEIDLNKDDFGYDVRSLVKAFYPFEEISMEKVDNPFIILKIDYLTDEIKVCFYNNNIKEYEYSAAVDYNDRKDTKNRLKRLIYRMLSMHTGKELPWGTLTGIRPVTLPMAFLEQGVKREQVEELIKAKYYISNEKIKLSLDVAETELRLLSNIDYKNGYSLYIGIPFCPTTCLYCSFTSFSIEKWEGYVDTYISALIKELEYTFSIVKKMPDTVYIGGGTPTSLSAERLDRLLGAIDNVCNFDDIREYTVEAGRPDSITIEKLEVLKKHKVSRISINPQTMNQKTLDLIGRRHTVEDTIEIYYAARKIGFYNINMDIIAGLPDETVEDVRHTLEEISKLSPDSLTVHSLALKRASRLNIDNYEYMQNRVENSQEIMKMAEQYAVNMGLQPYYLYRQKNMAGNLENVGYAASGKECLYNILIMEEKQNIIALGAGASSKKVHDDGRKTEHEFNIKDVKGYIERIDEMLERKRIFLEGD